MMLFSIRQLLILLFLLLSSSNVCHANRVVTFEYVENSHSCSSQTGELWDIEMGSFHVDCGNANHGCTPGHHIMIWGDFYSAGSFITVADVDMKACEFGTLMCTSNIVETEINVCQDLQLQDVQGNQICNNPGNYTFEASYLLPNHTWWEDFAVEGFSFQIYVTFDDDLVCHGQFVSRVHYGKERWMVVAVGSLALVLGTYYYFQKKRKEQQPPKIDLRIEEVKPVGDDDAIIDTDGHMVKPKSKRKKEPFTSADVKACPQPDEESVTSTAYLRMLDFSPAGLDHADRMDLVRQAHFDRLKQTRDARRGKPQELKSARL